MIWALAAAGLAAPLWDRRARLRTMYLAGLLACSVIAVCPGFYFREHYFVLMLPAVAMLAATAVRSLGRIAARLPAVGRFVAALVAVGALAQPLVVQRRILFELPPPLVSRAMYGAGTNPFPETVRVGQFLKEVSAADDRIAVMASEPEIYFYADRLSATGYVYMYPLTGSQPYAAAMRAPEMEAEVARVHPSYVVLLVPSNQFQMQLEMGGRHYEALCSVSVDHGAAAPLVMGDALRSYRPIGPSLLAVYHRKS